MKRTTVIINRLQAKGHWNIAKGKAERACASFLENRDRYEIGEKDEMLGRVQRRAGRAKANVRKTLRTCRNV